MVAVLAFSASRPAYITRMLSAIWARIDRSWVIAITLLTNPRSLNSISISPTARWVETSRAEVTSSAMSSDGFSRVERMIVTRWRMPPDSSKEYLSSTSALEPDEVESAASSPPSRCCRGRRDSAAGRW